MGRTATPPRADLLAFVERLRGSRRTVRRAEPYRRRGWTADQVANAADEIAAELFARGIRPGDRVALWLGDGPLWPAAFFGVLRVGGVAVPLDTSLPPVAVREAVAGLGIATWCEERGVPRLDLDLPRIELDESPPAHPAAVPMPPLPPDDPGRAAEVVLTSGTSGDPKAVTVGHGNLRAVLDVLDRGIGEYRGWLRVAPRLRIACALPLSHMYGQVLGVFAPALLKADAILVAPMPAPDLARTLRRERAWVLATVPRTLTLLGRWLDARGAELWGREGFERRLSRAADLRWWNRARVFARLRLELGPRLVAVVSGGAALDPGIAGFWRALGYAVVQGYGLTETAPLVTLDHPFDSRPGSLGRPLPGVEVRIGADQEILVRGANVAGGRVDPEGWLHTGDLGRLDAEGRLWFQGRRDERFVTPAGINVDSAAIAAKLAAEPGVVDALVFERPWGERGVASAVLVARPGTDPSRAVTAVNAGVPDAARIRAWRVWPAPDFPRTRTGKPRIGEVHAWLVAQAGTEDSVDVELDPVTRMVAEIGGVEGGALTPETRLGDALGSLDRVELATRIEMTYGVPLPPETAGPDRLLGELAAAVAAGPGAGAALDSGDAGPAGPRQVPEARWRHRLPVRAFRFAFAQGVLRPLWRSLVDLDAAGIERLAGLEPPFLVAANHLSELDPGAVLFALPPRLSHRIATAAMWEYFERAPAGRLQYALAVAGLDLIPLLQTGDWRPTLRIAGEIADRGGCALVYPEGERSTDGGLLSFRKGVSILAGELRLPVVPCASSGLLAVYPKGARWPRGVWNGRARVAVRFGVPIPAPRPGDDREALVEELRARIETLLREARVAAGRF